MLTFFRNICDNFTLLWNFLNMFSVTLLSLSRMHYRNLKQNKINLNFWCIKFQTKIAKFKLPDGGFNSKL